MKKLFTLCFALTLALSAGAQQSGPSTRLFEDSINHWYLLHNRSDFEHYSSSEYIAVADNLLKYQNEDGGWPKNIDWTAKMEPEEVLKAMPKRHRRSTFDNRNVYPQVEYLSTVYALSGDERYKESARRGIEYMLENQYPNGGWRGWDVDAITFNDSVIEGIMRTWQSILSGNEIYNWIDKSTRRRIKKSWNAGLEVILKTQYIQNGEKSVWCQQHDHVTLLPTKARSYELPSLAASESAGLVMLLMSIEKPSKRIIEAVKAAVKWFDKTKVLGKRVIWVDMPEGNPDDPSIKRDRRLIDDPDAEPLWGRFYELEDNRIFLCNRDGVKVYSLEEVLPERRVGYSWYGTWGVDVFKRYKVWIEEVE